MAELLLAAGKQVTMITPFPNLGPYLFLTGEAFKINRQLRAAGVDDHPQPRGPRDRRHGVSAASNAWAPDPVEW